MRLLHAHDFNFKVFQKNPEPYAILSHRWTDTETKLADIQTGRVGLSSRSNKVSRFAQYVKSQISDLEWIWIDSCCINQDSAAELSEGVNCMFDWYRKATVCIVYLPDVEHPSDLVGLRDSVWFERGWTLQEMLASKVMVFLTAHWQPIGHKGDATLLKGRTEVGPNIEGLLAERTTIPPVVLKDFSASHSLSIEERMSWMMGRDTLKEEDMFYALFGIFGVAPGANYGEKRHRARRRLLDAIEREGGKVGHASAAREEEQAAEIEAWLSPPDASTNHASARERHEPGTCAWLLQHEQYKRWKAGTKQHLWLHGKPGCGKSVLCSAVIEDLQMYRLDHTNIGLAYFYFTFSDDRKKSYDDLLLGLVAQFGRRHPARSMLRRLHDKSKQTKPSTQELEEILVSTVATFDEVFIALDALDESPELSGTRRNLLKRAKRLFSQSSKLRLFATSRYLADILGFMEDMPCEQISIQSCDVSADIQHYVVTQLSTEPRLREFTPAVKSMIEKNVSDNADGMFRWAFLLLDELARLKKGGTSTIRAALNRFPKDLDDVYTRILQDLQEHERKDVLTLLYWITYAREPLSLNQLVDTLIIQPENGLVDTEDRCEPGDILRLLTSLVITITDGDTATEDRARTSIDGATKIRLAHFTVQEYLESTRILEGDARYFHLKSAAGHYLLTQSCLTYVLYYSNSNDKKYSENDFMTFTLLQYAAGSWYHHSSLHNHSDVRLELKLLESDAATRDWILVHKPEQYWEAPFTEEFYIRGTNLYYASYMGLQMLVKLLLERGANVNAKGGEYGSALQAASRGGHDELVKLLLDKGANVNGGGGEYGSALQAASARGHDELVKLLLDKGANVNGEGGHYGSALQAASWEGHVELVKLLLDKGANVNAEGGYYGSALQAASWEGHVELVKLLLDKGANVNAEGGYYGSALQAASARGHDELVKLLLDKGANVNGEGGHYGSALQAASWEGHVELVKLLLDKGANVNAEGGSYGSALQSASTRGHVEVAKLLLDKGANVNVEGGYYGSALQAASAKGHDELVKLLLDKGANVNVEGGEYGSALQAASERGRKEVVKLLLDKGANVNAEGGKYGSAMHAASERGRKEVVKLLLDKGANVNAEGGEYGSALQAASKEDHVKVVELLLEKGANVNAEGGEYGSALQAASREGHVEVVELLLEKGANVNAEGGWYGSALQVASEEGHVEVVELLLLKGSNVNAEGGKYGSALQAASREGHVEVVELLLEKGANVNAEGGWYGSALQVASEEGHVEVVELLLLKGSNVNAEGGKYGSALQAASERGRKEVVKLLLDKGANVNAEGGWYGSALQAASKEGHVEVVELLLEKGANVNAEGGWYGSALQVASEEGHVEVVELLLLKGSNVNAEGGKYGSALQAASERGRKEVVKLLLDKGANVNAEGSEYGSALQAASKEGRVEVVELLLEKGTNVNAEEGGYGGALQAVARGDL